MDKSFKVDALDDRGQFGRIREIGSTEYKGIPELIFERVYAGLFEPRVVIGV
ncbi:MAG: hypothetical protein ACR2FY_19600 [Pirellulaceae bacterium]